jgi:hypothetical protein
MNDGSCFASFSLGAFAKFREDEAKMKPLHEEVDCICASEGWWLLMTH